MALMTPRVVYISAIALLALAAAIVPITNVVTRDMGEIGHGPVGFIAAVPVATIFALGAAVLAFRVVRARLALGTAVVGLLPAALLVIGLFALVLMVVG